MLEGRKALTWLMILMLIVLIVPPSAGSLFNNQVKKGYFNVFNSKQIIYVGGNGSGNYTKIQNAIDNASDGDTIFVYDDSSPYEEIIFIDKRITLIGENKTTTIIDGVSGRNVMYISSNKINVSGFTIKNSSKGPYNSAGIYVIDSDNIVIRNNIIVNNMYGILFTVSNIHTLKSRNYSKNLYITDSYSNTDNIIVLNTISNNNFGLSLGGSSKNYILKNNISNNDVGINLYPIYIGAVFEITSSLNKIKRNNIINNNKNSCDKCCNRWVRNYWDDWIGLKYILLRFIPYKIPGKLYCNFDWKPAIEPFDI